MRLPSTRVLAVMAGALAGALVLMLLLRNRDESPGAVTEPGRVAGQTPAHTGGRPEPVLPLGVARRSLKHAVDRAAQSGNGIVQAAAMLDGWPHAVVAASEPGAARQPMRMWSIAKVVTAAALLRQLGWGRRPGEEPSPDLVEAMHGALVRSENCRQRRMVLGLQHLAGGPEGARATIAAVLAVAGAEADLRVAVEPPEQICHSYLRTQESSIPDPFAPTLLLGTATWQIADLASFLHALGKAAYGTSVERYLLRLLRLPKGSSSEIASGEYTADLDWGAGRALAGLAPAYKAGWGGTLQESFVAVQGALVELGGERKMAIAVAFQPHVQPPHDDPGLTGAPAAIEEVMRDAVEGPFGRLVDLKANRR